MKHKFSKILGLGLALALLASMLVMATPVMATHTSSAVPAFASGESNVTGATGVILDVAVTCAGGEQAIKTVKMDFTAGFTVTGSGAAVSGWTASGPTADVVTYTATGAGIASGGTTTFHPVVTNPAAGAVAVPVITTTDVAASVAATYAFSSATGWIGFTAVTAGAAGNDIDIIYDAQTNAYDPLVISVSGDDITIVQETGASGNTGISTATEVAAAINDDAVAKLRVLAVVAVGKGATVVADMGSVDLAGGITSVADYNCVESPTTLTVIAVPDAIWVDDDGSDANTGTEASPVATIGQGLLIAPDFGTVNVKPGTYTLASTGYLHIDAVGLTLQSTDGAAVTIIDASGLNFGAVGAIDINVSEVTVDGFTIDESTDFAMTIAPSTTGVIVQNNVFSGGPKISISISGSDHLVADNTISDAYGIYLNSNVDDITIENNTITGATKVGEGAIVLSGLNDDNTITGNTITGGVAAGIFFWGAEGTGIMDGNVISNNTIDGNLSGIEFENLEIVITDLTITGNDIVNSSNAGILLVGTDVNWSTGNTVSNNNISGNTVSGINNGSGEGMGTENNWWGDATGPYHATTNKDGTGDTVSNNVDYRPYLSEEYGVEVTTISLKVGWNFISVPKTMAAATDTFGELLTGIDVQVAYSYAPASGWSAAKVDADPVEVLEGYWVDVNTAGTITLSYKEAAQEVPASKSLVGDAWNAIGFSRTTALDADTALMSVDGSWSTVLGWDAEGQVYEDSIIVGETGDMSPGKGYWIWMTEDDVLSAISG